MTVWGKIKGGRKREEMDRGSMKKKKRQSALLQSFKACILQEAFFTETEKQLKKGKIQFYTEKIPLQTRVTLVIFHIGLWCTCFWGQQSCFSHWDVTASFSADMRSPRWLKPYTLILTSGPVFHKVSISSQRSRDTMTFSEQLYLPLAFLLPHFPVQEGGDYFEGSIFVIPSVSSAALGLCNT